MKLVLTDVRLFSGGADLTSSNTKAELTAEVEDKDVTTFASQGWTEVIGGLKKGSVSAEGYWDVTDSEVTVDREVWQTLGGLGALTVCPSSATVGSLAYSMRAMKGSYTFLGSVGDVAPFQLEASSAWPLVRGVVAHAPGTPVTATGTGTGVELPAVPAGKRLYASLHVLSATGTTPSLTVHIESDVDNTFSSPQPVASFDAVSAPGSQVIRTNGSANADTFYRLTWDVSGTAPSFMFVVTIGVS